MARATASRPSRSRPTGAPSSFQATSRTRHSAVAIDLDTHRDPQGNRTRHFLADAPLCRMGGRPDPLRQSGSGPCTRDDRALAGLVGGKAQAASAQAQVSRFASYVAIDWSGAKGRRHKGIAIAEARGRCRAAADSARPRLVARGGAGVAAQASRAKNRPCSGSTSASRRRSIERGEYLLGEPDVPKTAREFWAYVDAQVATTRTSARRASSRSRTAGTSISASPTA